MLNEISNRSEHAKRHNLGDRSPSQTKDFASGQGFKTPDKGTQHEVLRLRGGSGRGSGRGSDQGLQPPLSRDALHPGSRPSSRLHSPFETKYINPELNDQVADLSHEVTQLINASKNWAPYQAIDVQIANLDYTYQDTKAKFNSAEDIHTSKEHYIKLDRIARSIRFYAQKKHFFDHLSEMNQRVNEYNIDSFPKDVQRKINREYQNLKSEAIKILTRDTNIDSLNQRDSNKLNEIINKLNILGQEDDKRAVSTLIAEVRGYHPIKAAMEKLLTPQELGSLSKLKVQINREIESIDTSFNDLMNDIQELERGSSYPRDVGDIREYTKEAALEIVADDFSKFIKLGIDLDNKRYSKNEAIRSYNDKMNNLIEILDKPEINLENEFRTRDKEDQAYYNRTKDASQRSTQRTFQRTKDIEGRRAFDKSLIAESPTAIRQTIQESLKDLERARRDTYEKTQEHYRAQDALGPSMANMKDLLSEYVNKGVLTIEQLKQKVREIADEERGSRYQARTDDASNILARHLR